MRLTNWLSSWVHVRWPFLVESGDRAEKGTDTFRGPHTRTPVTNVTDKTSDPACVGVAGAALKLEAVGRGGEGKCEEGDRDKSAEDEFEESERESKTGGDCKDGNGAELPSDGGPLVPLGQCGPNHAPLLEEGVKPSPCGNKPVGLANVTTWGST